jgi:hypothetical protein
MALITVHIISTIVENIGRFKLNLFNKLLNHLDVKLFKITGF